MRVGELGRLRPDPHTNSACHPLDHTRSGSGWNQEDQQNQADPSLLTSAFRLYPLGPPTLTDVYDSQSDGYVSTVEREIHGFPFLLYFL